MAWLVRFIPTSAGETSGQTDLLDQYSTLVSALWDLGTGGVAEQPTSLVAGFDRLETACRAQRLAERHGLSADVEAVDDGWIRRDSVEVAVTTDSGTESFPVVAGPAFGHGAHPTTRLCLDLMSNALVARRPATPAVSPGARVLDLGTGSGVLAIAAHRLGATDITASDIDASAIDSARFNTAANGVDVRLVHGDIDDVAADARRRSVGFDLIVANVLLGVHERVAAAAGPLLKTSGVLVLAGFLAEQAERVLAAYRGSRPALVVTEQALLDGWSGLALAEPVEAA